MLCKCKIHFARRQKKNMKERTSTGWYVPEPSVEVCRSCSSLRRESQKSFSRYISQKPSRSIELLQLGNCVKERRDISFWIKRYFMSKVGTFAAPKRAYTNPRVKSRAQRLVAQKKKSVKNVRRSFSSQQAEKSMYIFIAMSQ